MTNHITRVREQAEEKAEWINRLHVENLGVNDKILEVVEEQ